MYKFILKRLALTIPTFIALTFVTFVAIRLVPGDPIEVRTGERGISPERLAMLRHDLGLDQPVWQQYLHYFGKILTGDLGVSLSTHRPVLKEFFALFPTTIELTLAAMILAIVIGIPAGIGAALKRGRWFDQMVMGLSVTGFSMPIFWWVCCWSCFSRNFWGFCRFPDGLI